MVRAEDGTFDMFVRRHRPNEQNPDARSARGDTEANSGLIAPYETNRSRRPDDSTTKVTLL